MTVLLTNPKERQRFLRFAVVGVIGAVVDFGTMNILVNFFHLHLTAAGAISFIAAVLSNFLWNRYWTYPDSRSKPFLGQLLQFAFINALGLVIRVPILAFLEPALLKLLLSLPFKIPLFTPDFLADNLTLAVAVVMVMFWNFFANRYWTYNDVQS